MNSDRHSSLGLISILTCFGTSLFLTPLEAAENETTKRHIVAIDIGHTEKSPGAISATGIPEYRFNVKIAERLKASLAATPNIEPFIVSSSKAISLPERTRIALAANADLFISIHHDSAQDKYLTAWEVDGKTRRYSDQFSGYSVFVSRKNPQFAASFAAARRIGKAMSASGLKFTPHHSEPIAGENRPIIDQSAGVYAFDDLVVLKTASMPAVLVECGVILNRLEERSLLLPEKQATITAAIARGVREYFSEVQSDRMPEASKNYPKPGHDQTSRSLSPGRQNN